METESVTQVAKNLAEARKKMQAEIGKTVIGQEEPQELILLALLCGGHALLLGVPGVGKTLMASTLAKVLELDFRRIQFTPDLMPADITGADVLEEDASTRRHSRRFMEGPLFTNFLLADEINRTPPKTQAALLQAMQEHQVSIGHQTYALEPPFFVLATQNPIEMEGTYPLPEAQLDRFLFCIRVNYPSPVEEAGIVKGTTGLNQGEPQTVLHPEDIIKLQEAVRGVAVADDVVDYAVRITGATRPDVGEEGSYPDIANYIEVGASPRGSQTMILTAKARALLNGRLHVDFADVKALAPHVLRHRLVPNFRARADKVEVDQIVANLLELVPEEKP